jgi:hypothetical protein
MSWVYTYNSCSIYKQRVPYIQTLRAVYTYNACSIYIQGVQYIHTTRAMYMYIARMQKMQYKQTMRAIHTTHVIYKDNKYNIYIQRVQYIHTTRAIHMYIELMQYAHRTSAVYTYNACNIQQITYTICIYTNLLVNIYIQTCSSQPKTCRFLNSSSCFCVKKPHKNNIFVYSGRQKINYMQ